MKVKMIKLGYNKGYNSKYNFGVTNGFTKTLELNGTGYRARYKTKLELDIAMIYFLKFQMMSKQNVPNKI